MLLGLTSILMIFVIPFIIMSISEPLMNNKTFCWIYFSLFFVIMFVSGKINEKIECKTKEDMRNRKLEDIL